MATALATLMSQASARLAPHRTPIDRLERLESALGPGCPRIFIKRDDLLPFAGGGNKVRKLDVLVAEARASGADTLITCGAIQSNHARVTAAAGAALGLRVILVLSGEAPVHATGNLRLDRLLGAEVRVVETRGARDSAMEAAAEEVRSSGGHPYVIPMGGSNALGAIGFARAASELSAAGLRPDVIVHASSSGGTQAGLTAGCALVGLATRIIGISADEPAPALEQRVGSLIEAVARRLGAKRETVAGGQPVRVDDRHVGSGYGVPTSAAEEAIVLLARKEGVLLDPVYTGKAMAGLLANIRERAFDAETTVLFWHTGGWHDQ